MGATATGKTALALELAKHFDIEIISVDSALIYRDMDIGTAKPDSAELAAVPHHLVDIVDPTGLFSVWDFIQRSEKLIVDINKRGKMPVLVGGTMMYFNAFEAGLNRLPEANEKIRHQLTQAAAERGWPALHERLQRVDPVSAERIRPSDSQRIQRALEVFDSSGKTLSELQQQRVSGYPGSIHKIILAAPDRAALHARIEKRFHEMLAAGFIEEVERLKGRPGLDLNLPSMRCVGYRQIWRYLDGELSRTEMIEQGLAATRQLAKRQITWLRKQPQEKCFDCLNYRKDAIFREVQGAVSASQLETF